MIEELQLVVDRLAGEVGVPVELEDRRQRVVVYSSQQGPLDSVRRDSILGRETAPEVAEYFVAFGIHTSPDPVRIPGDAARGILPRLCVPARCRGRLMGFLWLIDQPAHLDPDAVDAARRAADYAALLLYQEQLPQRLAGSVLASLLSPSDALREIGAARAVEDGLLVPDDPASIVILQPAWNAGVEPSQHLADALVEASRRLATIAHLRLARRDHGVLLVGESTGSGERLALRAARAAQAAFRERLVPASAKRIVAAIGDPQPDALRLVTSYRQAQRAARIGAAFRTEGDIVEWQRLGAFRMLAQLPPSAISGTLDPRFVRLLAGVDHEVTETLERYLDLGGDVKRTSEALHLHRATLYYRLRKAERVAGFDLRDGLDRLTLHLNLKLSRLAPRDTPRPGPVGPVGGPAQEDEREDERAPSPSHRVPHRPDGPRGMSSGAVLRVR